jgi:hypothetical protein
MTSLTKEPNPKTFRYGFITSRTARLLYEHLPEEELGDEAKSLLADAEEFVEQILNGEAFVSGEREGLDTSPESLRVLGYGRRALTVLEQNVRDRAGLQHLLNDIRQTLSQLRQNENVDAQKVHSTARFFDVIADALLEEAIETSHATATMLT